MSGDGKYVVTGSADQTAILWEAATGRQLRTFRVQTNIASNISVCVALSRDAKHVVTGLVDKTAILWEAASGKKLQTLQGHTNPIWSVALAPTESSWPPGHSKELPSCGKWVQARCSRPSRDTNNWSMGWR